MIVRTLVTLALILLLMLPAATSFSRDGLAMMKVEAGARPAGMGGAFVSILDDPNSSAYNPAGAAKTDRFIATLGHNTYWENTRIETAYIATNFTRRTWFHAGLRYATVSDIERRSTTPTLEPEGLFDAQDVSFKGGLSASLTDKIYVGAAIGWFVQKIDVLRGSAFNVDLGAIYRPDERLSFGGSITNLGSDFSLSLSGQPGTEDISLPTTYRVGTSYQYSERYLGTADLVVLDGETHPHLGAEAWLHKLAAVRAGYMFNYDSKNFTAGASFVQRNFQIDYAFVPYSNNLGTSHLFNLTVII